jgi:hypothetical protein
VRVSQASVVLPRVFELNSLEAETGPPFLQTDANFVERFFNSEGRHEEVDRLHRLGSRRPQWASNEVLKWTLSR